MPQMIDVTGLSSEALRVVESLVGILRAGAGEPKTTVSSVSVFDLFGKAPRLRSGEDVARQIQEERDTWSEP